MIPVTRRCALSGTVGLLSALAGCSGPVFGSEESVSQRAENSVPDPSNTVETDPDTTALRASRGFPVDVRREDDRTQTDQRERTSRARREERYSLPNRGLVASRDAAERLTFADVEGVETARAFVAETNFETETLLIDPGRVGECYQLELCAVSWSETMFHTSYVRRYRDVDVACSTDAHDWLATFVRIPDALDPAKVNGSGSSTGTGGCRRRPRQRGESGETAVDGGESGEDDSPTSVTGGNR